MTNRDLLCLAGGVLAGLAAALAGVSQVEPPVPKSPAPKVQPAAPSKPCPDCRPRRAPGAHPAGARAVGDESEPTIDLLAMPRELRRPNINSKGLGCCVFRSIDYAAQWQGVPALQGFPEWMVAKGVAGGGTPPKVRELIPRIAADRKLPTPPFAQYEGGDPSFIELALATGRPVGVTWQGNHMLTCLHLDAEHACVLDNNSPNNGQWMPRATFLAKWKQGGGGWAVVLLQSPPPPPPLGNQAPRRARLARRLFVGKDCLCSRDCTCGCNQGGECRCEGGRPQAKPCPGPGPCPAPRPAPRPSPRPAPAPLPVWPDLTPEDLPDPSGGVDWVYGGVESYQLGERPVSREDLEALLADDTARPHLTLVGAREQREAALALLGDVSRYHVQQYDRGAWQLDCGFVADPQQVTVYLQDRTGRVLLRAVGVEGLAEKLRRTDPAYRDELAPTGEMVPARWLEASRPYLPWALGAGAILLLLARQRGAAAAGPAPAPQQQSPQQSPQLGPLDRAALEMGRELLLRRAAPERQPPAG